MGRAAPAEAAIFPPDTEVGRWLVSSPLGVALSASAADPEPASTDEEPGAVQVSDDLLDFDTIDVHTGETVNIRSVVTGETPLLFWLWSPY